MQQDEHDAGGSAPSIGAGAVEQAKGAAQDVADEARGTAQSLKTQAGELVDTVKDGLTVQAEQQKHAVATRIDRVAERVLQAAGDLHGDEAWLSSWLVRVGQKALAASSLTPGRMVNSVGRDIDLLKEHVA